eukprot:scaffold214_cov121-Isochrysis_galbana.AAC.5
MWGRGRAMGGGMACPASARQRHKTPAHPPPEHPRESLRTHRHPHQAPGSRQIMQPPIHSRLPKLPSLLPTTKTKLRERVEGNDGAPTAPAGAEGGRYDRGQRLEASPR